MSNPVALTEANTHVRIVTRFSRWSKVAQQKPPCTSPCAAADGYNKPIIPCYDHWLYLVAPQMTSAKMVTPTRSITNKMHIFRRDFCCKKKRQKEEERNMDQKSDDEAVNSIQTRSSSWESLNTTGWYIKISLCMCPIDIDISESNLMDSVQSLSLIHIWRCRRNSACRSRWSPYH